MSILKTLLGSAARFSLSASQAHAKAHTIRFHKVWSFQTGALIDTIPWTLSEAENKNQTMLYAASYSSTDKYLVAAGGGLHNQVKVFSTATRRVSAFFDASTPLSSQIL